MDWTDDEEHQAREIVTKLYEAAARLTHHDRDHASVRDFWLGGTPSERLIMAMTNAGSWEEANDLMLKTSGFPTSDTWPMKPKG
ncbi:MAG: hypothetical protein V4514_04220 [Pseudomonadota bacterium]|uniref:hypothetical protein n=1 Tax=Phenylobacterium sp. TaxID=1871053 RepID=UPI0025ED69B5|nr:hypothetical protein [Phenylobacterium sp.]MBT9471821.1 hypothetical protein [Phenylobacterium sp.]